MLHAIDDDASALYSEYGLGLELPSEHIFVQAELERWAKATEAGRAFLALDADHNALGFACLDVLHGEPYLDSQCTRVCLPRRAPW